MAVAADSLPVVDVLIMVLTVPSLDLAPRVSRRSVVGLRCTPLSYLSCEDCELL